MAHTRWNPFADKFILHSTISYAMVAHCRIAWSHSGLVAYIDGKNKVFVTWLHFVDGSHWDYAAPVPVPVPTEGKPIHLSWSFANYDLAITDELGRLHIISIGVSGSPTNQIIASAVRDQRPRPAELDRLVGLHWLSSSKNTVNSQGNTALREGWEIVSPMKPFVPVRVRSSLVAVNGNGMLRLLVQTSDFKYSEVDELIPGVTFVSKASFVELSPESLLVIVVTGENLLVIFEAKITHITSNTSSVQQESYQGLGSPSQSTNAQEKPDQVSLSVHEVASAPLQKENEELLELSTEKTTTDSNQANSLVIRAVYPSYAVNFTLNEISEGLHHSFFELFNASDPVPPQPVKLWSFAEKPTKTRFDVKLKDYVSLKDIALLVYMNGNVVTERISGKEHVSQLDKVGLKFNENDIKNAESLCVSPSGCCIAYFPDADDSVGIPKMTSVNPTSEMSRDDAQKVASVLAFNVSNMVNLAESGDDIIKVCWEVLHNPILEQHSEVIFNTLAHEIQTALQVPLIAPEDQNKVELLISNSSPFQRWLSFLSSLGTQEGWKKTPGSAMCYTLIHLHQIAFNITWTMRRVSQKPRAHSIEQYRFEIQAAQYHFTTMFGPIRWVTDLVSRITQELYSALKSSSPLEYLMKQPNVYASLLMSNISRYLLRYILRAVRTLNGVAKTLTEQESRVNAKLSTVAQVSQDSNLASEARARLQSPANYAATRAFKKFGVQLQSIPVKLDVFEKFILNLEEKYKLLVKSTQMSDDLRTSLESDLTTTAKVPQKFAPLVKLALDTSDKLLFPLLDIPNLYFYDTTWINLEATNDEDIDGIRKRVILPQESTEVCSRCHIKSIYGTESGKQSTQWQFVFRRYCVCGGTWQRLQDHS